ncbi:hypothetical protein GVAV_002719 [Gurleya vavrai]
MIKNQNYNKTVIGNRETNATQNKSINDVNQKYVFLKKNNQKTQKSMNTDKNQGLINSATTYSGIDLNLNLYDFDNYEKEKNTNGIIKLIVQLKEWLCKIFSFYTASNKEKNIQKHVKISKKSVVKNPGADFDFYNNFIEEKEQNDLDFKVNYKNETYLQSLRDKPYNYFNEHKFELKNHKVNIIIKQEFSNIGFYKNGRRILIMIDFNIENKNITFSLPYTDKAIEIIKNYNITNNGNIKFTNLLFLNKLQVMSADCFLANKDYYHLELLKDENYVKLALPKTYDPNQYSIFLEQYPDAYCYNKDKDFIYKLEFGKLRDNDYIFIAMVYEIFKPFFFKSNIELKNFFNKFKISKEDIISFFTNLFLTEFDYTVNAEKNLYYDSERYFLDIKKLKWIPNKKDLIKKSLLEKITDEQINNSNPFFAYDYRYVINQERLRYLAGISPNFVGFSSDTDKNLKLNVNLFSKTISEFKNHDVSITIYDEIDTTKFYQNIHRIVFFVDFKINNKKFYISAPYSQFAITRMIQFKINVEPKVFIKLNFIINIFQSLDDVFLIVNKIHLKLSTHENIVKFGFSKLKNDYESDIFYNYLLNKKCMNKYTDNLFTYKLERYSITTIVISYLFYTFNPFLFFTVEEYDDFMHDFYAYEKINFYEVILRLFNLDSKYHVNVENNLGEIIQNTGFYQYFNISKN